MPHSGEKQKEEGKEQKKQRGNKEQQRGQGYEVKYTAVLEEVCSIHNERFKSSLQEKALATCLKDHPWQRK